MKANSGYKMTMQKGDWLTNNITPKAGKGSASSAEQGSYLNNQIDKVTRDKARDEKKFPKK
jgi:hypothetical protein